MRIKRKRKLSLITILIFGMSILLMISAFLYYNYNRNVIGGQSITKNEISLAKETELRTGPDSTYPVIKLLLSGTSLEKYSESNDWVEVRTTDNIIGWVAGWNVSGSQIKSPEEKMKEKLTKYAVVLNPLLIENLKDYNLELANRLKYELENLGIKVYLTRENENTMDNSNLSKFIVQNKANIVLDINTFNNEQYSNGVSLHYSNSDSYLLSKYMEKSLNNNYISRVNSSEKNEDLVKVINEKIPEVFITSGNINSNIDINILNNEIYKNEYAKSLARGVEEYFYYLISIDNYNEKRREQLINSPHKGMNIPFYYTKQSDIKDISYGSDNNKTIADNGDAIVALTMIEHYLNPNSTTSVKHITEWAGSKYYTSGQGNSYTIVKDFADKYNLKVENIEKTDFKKVDEALKNNKPLLVQFSKGSFDSNRINYKVIRGLEDNKYYFNDPDDDDVKLNTYIGFRKEEFEKGIIQIWAFSK